MRKKNPEGLSLIMHSDTEEWERELKADDTIVTSLGEMDEEGFTHFEIRDDKGHILFAFFDE